MKIQIAELTEQDKKERKLPKVTITFGGFKNMKIQINDQQPLEDVVIELERLGYKKNCNLTSVINWIVCFEGGFYCQYGRMNVFNKVLTTLAELKEM